MRNLTLLSCGAALFLTTSTVSASCIPTLEASTFLKVDQIPVSLAGIQAVNVLTLETINSLHEIARRRESSEGNEGDLRRDYELAHSLSRILATEASYLDSTLQNLDRSSDEPPVENDPEYYRAMREVIEVFRRATAVQIESQARRFLTAHISYFEIRLAEAGEEGSRSTEKRLPIAPGLSSLTRLSPAAPPMTVVSRYASRLRRSAFWRQRLVTHIASIHSFLQSSSTWARAGSTDMARSEAAAAEALLRDVSERIDAHVLGRSAWQNGRRVEGIFLTERDRKQVDLYLAMGEEVRSIGFGDIADQFKTLQRKLDAASVDPRDNQLPDPRPR